jgi:hypothetical protein
VIVVSRLDTINYLHRHSVNPESEWWKKAFEFDVVGERHIGGLIDDRGFFGRADKMICLENLFDGFGDFFDSKTSHKKQNNSPERILYLYLRQACPETLKVGLFEKVSPV